MPRWVLQDTDIGGVPIPAGSVIQVHFSASNRDEKQFPCPADVDLTRKGLRGHLAFGMGVHYCLGSVLARMELAVSMNRILDRLDDLRINATEPLGHRPMIVVRALASLPIQFRRIPRS